MKTLLVIFLMVMVIFAHAQNVGIGTLTPDPSAQLDVQNTAKGILIPKMNAGQRAAISNPAFGLLVFQTDQASGFYYNAGSPSVPNWISLSSVATSWNLTGNTGTNFTTNFLGTTDNVPLMFRVNNDYAGRLDGSQRSYFLGRFAGTNISGGLFCVGFGDSALYSLTNGSNNVAIGSASQRNNLTGLNNTAVGTGALYSNSASNFNTAVGARSQYNNTAPNNTSIGTNSLFSNTTGVSNTGVGAFALSGNITGYSNVAVGVSALPNNFDRSNLVAIGDSALFNNGFNAVIATQSIGNTAVGSKGLYNNTTGFNNTSLGNQALFNNITGNSNTGEGYHALFNNTAGSSNTAEGYLALNNNTTGFSNVSIGVRSLFNNTTVGNIVAIGDSALFNNGLGGSFANAASSNTAVGSKALFNNTVGNLNTAVGYNSLFSNAIGISNTAIGSTALYNFNQGIFNIAVGDRGLVSLTAGQGNIGIGLLSSPIQKGSGNIIMGTAYNTTSSFPDSVIDNIILGSRLGIGIRGSKNILFGYASGGRNIYGSGNIAIGDSTLGSIVVSETDNNGFSNVAIGNKALAKNFTHSNLVAIGDSALFNNGSGGTSSSQSIANTAVGSKSLYNNITGSNNTALGLSSLKSNVGGNHNIAIGAATLSNSVNNGGNIAIGDNVLTAYNDGAFDDSLVAIGTGAMINNTFGFYNTAVGAGALHTVVSGSSNTALGVNADISLSGLTNSTALGYNAIATASNQVMLGNTSVTSVKAAGSFVIYSDGRFKRNIQDNVPGLDFITALRPVTYHYDIHSLNAFIGLQAAKSGRSDSAEDAIRKKEEKQYSGFIAQEVEATAAKLGYDFSGLYKPQNNKDPYGLSYADFVVPLVKAVQEQQVMIKKLQEEIELLKRK